MGPGATPTGDGGPDTLAGVKMLDLSLPLRALKSAREEPMVVAGRVANPSVASAASPPLRGLLLCWDAGRLRGFEPPTVPSRADIRGSARLVPVASMFRADAIWFEDDVGRLRNLACGAVAWGAGRGDRVIKGQYKGIL